jgi:hypothetical protein
MPGVDPEDIEVLLYENVLTIKGNTKKEREHKEGGYLMRERCSVLSTEYCICPTPWILKRLRVVTTMAC